LKCLILFTDYLIDLSLELESSLERVLVPLRIEDRIHPLGVWVSVVGGIPIAATAIALSSLSGEYRELLPLARYGSFEQSICLSLQNKSLPAKQKGGGLHESYFLS